jgi:hypothetical protein
MYVRRCKRCLPLFSKPGRWTQKVSARDRTGKTIPVFGDEACAFDIEGAIRRAAGKDDRDAYAPRQEDQGAKA